MKVAPRLLPAMLATLATLSAAGCRTASMGSIAHNRPPEVRPQSTFDLQEFVAEHNQNAERIQSLEAKPAITVTMGPQGDAKSGAVVGHLAVERPRNFKLELSHSMSNIADIGSNDERFWFWFQNKKDKSVYYCDYTELTRPRWQSPINPTGSWRRWGCKGSRPMRQLRSRRPGTQPGTTVLTFAPTKAGGQTYSRVMVVSDSTLKVNEFQVISSDGKATIARATIKKYRDLPVAGPTSEESSTAARETCSMPENIVLEWKREMLSLNVVLKEVRINQFDTSKRAARFVQPTIAGYTPVNLAEVARQKDPARSTAVRETIPVPEPRSHVRLNPPLQIRGEDAAANTPRRQDQGRPKSPMLLPVLDLDVVNAPVPTAPDSPADRSSGTALATNPGISLER